MKRIASWLLACVSMSVLTIALVDSPALAGRNANAIYSSSSGRELAYAAFRSSGDKISAQDVAPDKHSAVTVYVIEGESTRYLWDHNGASSTAVIKTIGRAEGKSIKFKACIGEYSTRKVLHCSSNQYGVF